ncbi:MFS transporter [Pseudonocardia pini]|uniref:MFS transporter n=1 Tax=Pseudonocardia pini TaxID=2758030 RepID=UPI0015F0F1D0|nr:MFS transporter [Pseudonocardia pini]
MPQPPAPRRRSDVRAVTAAAIGNYVELFDLTVFGFFAVTIGQQFFPSDDPTASLLSAFITFGLGFVARPAGALILGRLGDKHGRKRLLVITMLAMAVASLGIAVLPTYASIGVAAPVLLVVLRLLQGFAAGGEWGGAAALITESASERRRGLFGSFHQAGFVLGTLTATLCAFVLNASLTEEQLGAWGWRIPFVIGFLLVPIALYIRSGIREPEEFQAIDTDVEQRTPLREALTQHWRGILAVIGIGGFGTATGYVANQFLNAFSVGQLGMARGTVTGLLVVGSAFCLVLIPVFGALSDRIGRLPLLGGAAVLFLVVAYPMFALFVGNPGVPSLLALILVLQLVISASIGPMVAALAELFPARVRTTGLSLGYNVTVALFGGFAPYIATLLADGTGSLTAPILYPMAIAPLAIGTIWWVARRQRAGELRGVPVVEGSPA